MKHYTQTTFFSLNKLIIFIIITIGLQSCQTVDMQGQYVDNQAIEELKTKAFSKEQVIELIGTPTTIPDYSKDTWYYIQRGLARRAWFEPKVVEQRIVKIRFNSQGMVEEVDFLQNGSNEQVQVVSEYTKTYGTELNGIQKFVKNIGRFNKTTDGNKKKK